MIKFCNDQWNANRDRLEKALREDKTLHNCDYEHLLGLVVRNILNQEDGMPDEWDAKNITVTDNGGYSGVLMFLIPRATYEPSEYEYLLTFIDYGSCSGCDALLRVQACGGDTPTETQIKDYMMICKDLVTNMVKPYNDGWRHNYLYDPVTEEGNNG